MSQTVPCIGYLHEIFASPLPIAVVSGNWHGTNLTLEPDPHKSHVLYWVEAGAETGWEEAACRDLCGVSRVEGALERARRKAMPRLCVMS